MKIGLVDLDTSHPAAWTPLLREMGHDVVGVFDHGDVHPSGYAQQFAQEHGIATVFSSLTDMADAVDAVVLHGCDWDQRVTRARPFADRRRAILLDKPVAGRLADLQQIEDWHRRGVRVAGGSALRYCPEVVEHAAATTACRDHTALCGCAVDDFNYGIHAYAMLAGLMGGDALAVRHLGQYGQRRVEVRWRDGRLGWLVIGRADQWLPFYATTIGLGGVRQIKVDPNRLYRALLASVLPYLAGDVDEPPVPIEDWLAPERWALAARQSQLSGDRPVEVAQVSCDVGHDGAAFAASYRAQRAANA